MNPGGHAYPAGHRPLQSAVAAAGAPQRPPGHGAVQADVVSPSALPNTPAGQSVQMPAVEYRPGEHCAGRGLTDPGAQSYPASHTPVHWDDVAPGSRPYRPAGRQQAWVASVDAEWESWVGHGWRAHGRLEATSQRHVPAMQGPLQSAYDVPVTSAKRPRGQRSHSAARVLLEVLPVGHLHVTVPNRPC